MLYVITYETSHEFEIILSTNDGKEAAELLENGKPGYPIENLKMEILPFGLTL